MKPGISDKLSWKIYLPKKGRHNLELIKNPCSCVFPSLVFLSSCSFNFVYWSRFLYILYFPEDRTFWCVGRWLSLFLEWLAVFAPEDNPTCFKKFDIIRRYHLLYTDIPYPTIAVIFLLEIDVVFGYGQIKLVHEIRPRSRLGVCPVSTFSAGICLLA